MYGLQGAHNQNRTEIDKFIQLKEKERKYLLNFWSGPFYGYKI